MLIELLGLGMPMAAAFGWWVGRKNAGKRSHLALARHSLSQQSLARSNHHRSRLIVEDIYRMNPASVDLQFALAALYREQGDYSRAVDMHQSILENKQLQSGLYARVSIELARDYLSAGFLDRAENCLNTLVDKQLLLTEALHLLLEIYEQTKEWKKAIVIAKRLKYLGEESHYLIAQYCCELAQEDLLRGRLSEAFRHYQHACLIDARCARANLGLAELYQQQQDHVKAIFHYRVLLDNHPDYLSLMVEPLYACYEALERSDEFLTELQANAYYRSFISVILIQVKHIDKTQGREKALNFIDDALRTSASLHLLHVAMVWSFQDGTRISRGLRSWQMALERYLASKKLFACKGCGQRYDKLHWHCEACGDWGAIVPLMDQARIHQSSKQAIDYAF